MHEARGEKEGEGERETQRDRERHIYRDRQEKKKTETEMWREAQRGWMNRRIDRERHTHSDYDRLFWMGSLVKGGWTSLGPLR